MVDRLLGRPPRERSTAGDGGARSADPLADVWARVQLARNFKRPHTLELVRVMADEFVEIHGDRLFADDEAIVAGFARMGGRRLVVVGHQKGSDTEENIRRNFGLPHPEGFRKAMRAMELAERFGLPVLTLVDVQGAFPGAASEERGVAEAIARSIALMTRLRTPIVTVITGEGGSGGALAIAAGDVVIALENAVYSVISPEGCATILWRSADHAAEAALAMRIGAREQQELGVIDLVVAEPAGGAHVDPVETGRRLRAVVLAQLDRLTALPIENLVEARYRRYRELGPYVVVEAPNVPPLERPGGLTDRLRGLIDAGQKTIGGTLPNLSNLPNLPGNPRRRDEPPTHDEV